MKVRVHIGLVIVGLFASPLAAQAAKVATLQKQLRAKDPAERASALAELERLGAAAARAVPDLVPLCRSGQPAEAEAALRTLVAIGEAAVAPLGKLLDDDTHRAAAVTAATRLGPVAAPLVGKLTKLWARADMALSDQVEDCVVAIGVAAVPELARCVADFSLQHRACYALRRMKSVGTGAVPALRKLLLSKTAGHWAAVEPLGAIGDASAVPDLVQVLRGGVDRADVAQQLEYGSLVRALGSFGGDAAAAVPLLASLVDRPAKDADSIRLQETAIAALADIGEPQEIVLAALRVAAAKPQPELQRAAKVRLDAVQLPKAVGDEALRVALQSPNAAARARALDVVVARGAAAAAHLRWVVALLERDRDRGVRRKAVAALRALGSGSAEVLKALDAAATDADQELATAAQEAREALAGK